MPGAISSLAERGTGAQQDVIIRCDRLFDGGSGLGGERWRHRACLASPVKQVSPDDVAYGDTRCNGVHELRKRAFV